MMTSGGAAVVCLVLIAISLTSGARVRYPRHRVKSEVQLMEPASADRWLMYEPLPPPAASDVQMPWRKRAGKEPPSGSSGSELADSVVQAGKNIANQFMLRSPRGNRPPFDVPQIECPPAEDGMKRFACPTPDRMGRYRCVGDHVLCDGYIDCPNSEDEDRHACMFYKTTKAHLDVLADALLRWARGR